MQQALFILTGKQPISLEVKLMRKEFNFAIVKLHQFAPNFTIFWFIFFYFFTEAALTNITTATVTNDF